MLYHVLLFKTHHLPSITALFVREIIDPALYWPACDASQSRKIFILFWETVVNE